MQTYTKREIARLLGCSIRTVEMDVEHLDIVPTKGDRNSNLYSERDFNLISQLREYCKSGQNSRNSFVPLTLPEVVEEKFNVTKLTTGNKSLVVDNLESSLEVGLIHDPFFDLEILQRVSNNNWLLPVKRLAPILSISPKYLNQQTQYIYCGFVARKELYAHNKSLWSVRKIEIDEWNR